MRTRRTSAALCSLLVLCLVSACGEEEDPGADEAPTSSPSASSPSASSPSASSTGSASPSEEPSAPAGETALTTKGLGQGSPPAVAFLAAADPAQPPGTWSLVRPSGEQLRLDVASPFDFATMGNGLVLLAADGDSVRVSVVDGNGVETRGEEVLGYRLAVTPDRSIVAWLTDEQAVRVVEGGGGRSFDLPKVPQGSELGAILGRGTCEEMEPEGGGCTAFVNTDEPRSAYVSTSHGFVDVAGPMLAVVDGAADGRLVGLLSVTDEGSCSAIFNEGDDVAWETCDHTLTGFSPAGTRVLGTDAYLDGFGQRSVAFLDAAGGTLVHQFTSKGRGPSVIQTAWEDEDHVLAVVYERGRWSIVRLGADGAAELAFGPLAGSDLDRPFVLAAD
jgi:hypothetical protein